MARAEKTPTFEVLIAESVERVVQRMLSLIDKQVDRAVAARVASAAKGSRGPLARKRPAARPRARVELSSWVADRRARRVPNFVIEMTSGLDTKKKIVARFGENAKFEKGKPLPQVRLKTQEASGGEAQAPKARPPVVRKAAAAAR